MKKISLAKRLQIKKPVLLDGAMGTEILHRGIPTTLPLWSAEAILTHPEVIQKIHEDYISAGAEIIITNTFRTTDRAFAKREVPQKARQATLKACELAQNAIKKVKPHHTVYVAGSVAPLEDCYSPDLTPDDETLKKEHMKYVQDLKDGNVDFILLETMMTLRETKAALEAAKKLDMPVAVSFCINEDMRLLGNESLAEAISLATAFHPLFVGVNCITLSLATKGLKKLKTLTSLPLSVYAQGDGNPEDSQGWEFKEEKNLSDYIAEAKKWKQLGASIIGGCCGTTSLYIKKLFSVVYE